VTRVRLARAEQKFSCAHMTVFPDGRKERLHGHNYTLAIEIELAEGGAMLEFGVVRAAIAELCGGLRERLLLPGKSSRYQGAVAGGELEFRLCGARYVVPADDALVLPIDNVTVEALAGHLVERLAERLAPALAAAAARTITVTVEESPGQGASVARACGAV
jgi:6-pyruvoyltetrahydropterin/6-carboxytetrahydropterin synthase